MPTDSSDTVRSLADAPPVSTAPSPHHHGAGNGVYRLARKVVILVIGVTVILAGVVMLVAPGPGVLTIAGGLGILATEFVWAARVYHRVKMGARTTAEALLPRWLWKRQ